MGPGFGHFNRHSVKNKSFKHQNEDLESFGPLPTSLSAGNNLTLKSLMKGKTTQEDYIKLLLQNDTKIDLSKIKPLSKAEKSKSSSFLKGIKPKFHNTEDNLEISIKNSTYRFQKPKITKTSNSGLKKLSLPIEVPSKSSLKE